MTNRTNYQAPTVLPDTMPQMVSDDGSGDYQRTLANSFLTVAGNAHKQALAADLSRAQTEGQKHGYDAGKSFRPMKSSSLFARTYNDSGVATAVTRMTMDAQQSVKKNYERNSANPSGLKASLEKYKEGYTAELPDEMQTPFVMQFDQMANTVVSQAGDNLKKLQQQEAAAQFKLYEREMENTIEVFAKDAFKGGETGDMAQKSLATLRKGYAERLMMDGPQEEYSVGGYKVKAGTGRSGAFSPVDIAEKMVDFDKKILEAGVLGNFRDEVEAGRGVDSYMAFANGSMEVTTVGEDGKPMSVNVSELLTDEEQAKIAEKMRTHMNGIRGLQDAEQKNNDRLKKDYQDKVVADAYKDAYGVEILLDGSKMFVSGDPMKLQQKILTASQDPNVEPETLDKLIDLQKKVGRGDIDDGALVGQTSIDIAEGRITSYDMLPARGLSDATRVKMLGDIDARNKGQHWSTSTRYKTAEQYADAVLAPAKAAGFNIFGDSNSASAADRAEWSKRMIEETLAAEAAGTLPNNPNAQPGKTQDGRDQFDFVKRGNTIADEIANRRKAPATDPEMSALDKEISDLDAKMSNPSADQDDKAIAKRYKELQDKKNALIAKKQMGAY